MDNERIYKLTDKNEIFDWISILENRENAVMINDALRILYDLKDSKSKISAFCRNFMQQCCVVLYKHDIAAGDVFLDIELPRLFVGSHETILNNVENYIVETIRNVWLVIEEKERSTELIEKVKVFIDKKVKNEFSAISRDELARNFFVNPSYLSHLFKMKMGISLSTYICQQKIAFAKQLLQATNDKIQIISDRAGYVNVAYFSKVFKRETGMTPTEYRMKINKCA